LVALHCARRHGFHILAKRFQEILVRELLLLLAEIEIILNQAVVGFVSRRLRSRVGGRWRARRGRVCASARAASP
jgi:hypothetical protein